MIAVDPSSTLTGGAVLGDRIRMMHRHADDGVFLRAWPAVGARVVLPGRPQSSSICSTPPDIPWSWWKPSARARMARTSPAWQTVVVVEAPGLGNGVQAIKSGLLEVGDVVVLNKADQPGAEDAMRLLRAWVRVEAGPNAFGRPVLATTATTGAGVPELLAAIDRHWAWLQEHEALVAHRAMGARAEVLTGLRARLDRQLDPGFGQLSWLTEVITRVARREMDAAPRRGGAAATLSGDRARRPAARLAISAAVDPAPMPLSMLTTTRPGAHDLTSIVVSAPIPSPPTP